MEWRRTNGPLQARSCPPGYRAMLQVTPAQRTAKRTCRRPQTDFSRRQSRQALGGIQIWNMER